MSRLNENWRDIVGYENIYQISDNGKVRSLDRKSNHNRGQFQAIKGKILSINIRGNYYEVGLSKFGLVKSKRIHRLVAESFIPNPENKPFVNHIDGNKLNNVVENLEWCTPSYNIQHAFDNKLMVARSGKNHKDSKPIFQIDDSENVIDSFISIKEAATKLNICRVGISLVCSGKLKKTKGFR
ncbi:NUMOD4 domain-containing protein [Epilithonimonas xixisoli]|uniref:NUMOD1 domain-containing protein n=1 Tax=Epilithonimonas xixisoli TaxID=1476462 RepID=A0A4R8I513_9FLAO|nr:NUMOD4 domain-containing protein [Epilithonimonas xixisoli]TDX83973.1 NUMOD1 domain-containing protein [Epilithonimonas xixisoli]